MTSKQLKYEMRFKSMLLYGSSLFIFHAHQICSVIFSGKGPTRWRNGEPPDVTLLGWDNDWERVSIR